MKIFQKLFKISSWKFDDEISYPSTTLPRPNKSEDNERLEVNEGEDLNLKCSPPKGYPKRVEFYKNFKFFKIFRDFFEYFSNDNFSIFEMVCCWPKCQLFIFSSQFERKYHFLLEMRKKSEGWTWSFYDS